MTKPRNERNQAVTKFCVAMEEHRRTEAGRVRTAKEFVAHFFPYDESKAADQLFRHMPNDVRGPVLAKWGIRGAKAALKDDDERVKVVVHDALVAGDIDEAVFEEGVTPELVVDWIVLAEWWSFWRKGRLTGGAIQKALATARELALIDDAWFLLNIQGRGGKLKGTDVLCDTLSKDQIVGWLRKIHEGGDGSAAGIIAALGWETVLAKTAQDALLFALDQFARKAGLFVEVVEAKPIEVRPVEDPTPPAQESPTGQHSSGPDAHPTMNAPTDSVAMAEAEAGVSAQTALEVAIPDIPPIDEPDPEPPDEPSIPSISIEERSLWSSGQSEESPKLAEARAAMMETLMASAQPEPPKREAWDESEVPAKPSSLEWPEPPPVVVSAATAEEEAIPLDESDLQKASVPKVPVPKAPPIPPIPRKPGTVPRPR